MRCLLKPRSEVFEFYRVALRVMVFKSNQAHTDGVWVKQLRQRGSYRLNPGSASTKVNISVYSLVLQQDRLGVDANAEESVRFAA